MKTLNDTPKNLPGAEELDHVTMKNDSAPLDFDGICAHMERTDVGDEITERARKMRTRMTPGAGRQ